MLPWNKIIMQRYFLLVFCHFKVQGCIPQFRWFISVLKVTFYEIFWDVIFNICLYQGTWIYDLFQTKKYTFSTCAFIWVHFKTVYYFSQPIFLIFTFKNALHKLVIELCSALETFKKIIYGYLLKLRAVL